MFNVSVNDKKNIYRSKPVMNVDTTGSSGDISIPKPLTYDYMPEGYPKKDGWSVEWDGNIDGKTSAIGEPLYKFSDRVLTYEEFLSAMVVRYQGGGSYSMMVSETDPRQHQDTDAISTFICSGGAVQVLVVSEDNAEVEGIIFSTKGLYARGDLEPFKLIKETYTPIDMNFIPKNLNVVFSIDSSTTIPNSCNVAYDELIGWLLNGTPVFAICKMTDHHDGYVSDVANILDFKIYTDSLKVYYKSGSGTNFFKYNSDGTFSGGES